MKHSHLLTIVALVCVVGLAAAQSPSNQQQPTAFTPPDPGLIKLEFPGGTAQQYIDAVRAASDDANIVVMGDLAAITMPAVKLRNVDTWAAVRILNELPQQQKNLLILVEAGITSDEPDQARVYTVRAQVTRGSLDWKVESTVISVADVLHGEITADDLLTAVEIALEVVGKVDEPAEIKFHKETGLLIARGTGDQIAAIHEVVEQLRMQMRDPSESQREQASLNEARTEIQELQRAVVEKNIKIAQLSAENEALKSKLPATNPQ